MSGERVIYDEAAAFSRAAIKDTPAGGSLNADLARLRLIREAQARGATWSAIGRALGISGRQARRDAHRLAKRAGRAWRLEENQKAAAPAREPGPPYVHTFGPDYDEDGNEVWPEPGLFFTITEG